MLIAKNQQPAVDFLFELSATLSKEFECAGLDLWTIESSRCLRWEYIRKPERFLRNSDVELQLLIQMIKKDRNGFTIDQEKLGALIPDPGASILAAPLHTDDELVGLLLVKGGKGRIFMAPWRNLFSHIAQLVGLAVAFHRVELGLRERAKEITCLYELTRIASSPELGVKDILARLVEILPPAWQYPDITVARVTLDDQRYQSGDFASVRVYQLAKIAINGKVRGDIRVGYLEERPVLDEGPFLAEERHLIDTVAKEISIVLERKTAEEDRLRLQDQLLHADRLATIGQLAAGVAHELNEPLGGILGFSQLAAKHPGLPDQVRRDLSKIESAALHSREVVRKLLLFARQSPPIQKRLHLNHLIKEGLYFLESRCTKSGIDIKLNLAADLPPIKADPSQMHQILTNLVVNAIQAMDGGGVLTVESAFRDGWVRLAVSDTGCGMSREILDQVFVPFFTTKDVGEGTGLGLPVVQGIVASHGGSIDVQSRPGAGSCFEIRLPPAPQAIEGMAENG